MHFANSSLDIRSLIAVCREHETSLEVGLVKLANVVHGCIDYIQETIWRFVW